MLWFLKINVMFIFMFNAALIFMNNILRWIIIRTLYQVVRSNIYLSWLEFWWSFALDMQETGAAIASSSKQCDVNRSVFIRTSNFTSLDNQLVADH